VLTSCMHRLTFMQALLNPNHLHTVQSPRKRYSHQTPAPGQASLPYGASGHAGAGAGAAGEKMLLASM
jgi:hypothetical protein